MRLFSFYAQFYSCFHFHLNFYAFTNHNFTPIHKIYYSKMTNCSLRNCKFLRFNAKKNNKQKNVCCYVSHSLVYWHCFSVLFAFSLWFWQFTQQPFTFPYILAIYCTMRNVCSVYVSNLCVYFSLMSIYNIHIYLFAWVCSTGERTNPNWQLKMCLHTIFERREFETMMISNDLSVPFLFVIFSKMKVSICLFDVFLF